MNTRRAGDKKNSGGNHKMSTCPKPVPVMADFDVGPRPTAEELKAMQSRYMIGEPKSCVAAKQPEQPPPADEDF